MLLLLSALNEKKLTPLQQLVDWLAGWRLFLEAVLINTLWVSSTD